MKLPEGKRVSDLTPEEREEAEAAMTAHIEAYQSFSGVIEKFIVEMQEAVTEAAKADAPGILEPIMVMDQLASMLYAIGRQLKDHAAEDERAFEDGLEALERLGDQREQEAREQESLKSAGLGQVIRPRPSEEDQA